MNNSNICTWLCSLQWKLIRFILNIIFFSINKFVKLKKTAVQFAYLTISKSFIFVPYHILVILSTSIYFMFSCLKRIYLTCSGYPGIFCTDIHYLERQIIETSLLHLSLFGRINVNSCDFICVSSGETSLLTSKSGQEVWFFNDMQ